MNVVSSMPLDLLILTNGPGEVMTWVRPVVTALRWHFGEDRNQVRISVLLSPCPHASGQEAALVQQFSGVDRVQEPAGFWPFLLWGRTVADWPWHPQGAVIFLGGDQFFAVVAGRRLGYPVITYAEITARWLSLVDRCGLAHPHQLQDIPPRWRQKVTVIGDLMADIPNLDAPQQTAPQTLLLTANTELIGFLPGSKATKLWLGVPFGLAIADLLQQQRPQVQLVFPVAPTLSLTDLARYADSQQNPYIAAVEGSNARLVQPQDGLPYFLTPQGAQVWLWTDFPAYDLLTQCQLCVTTIGANTAELTSLAVPMIVILPTQQLDMMRAWDGIPGLLANLPWIGTSMTRLITKWMLRNRQQYWAWPNIWANREIVPERVEPLYPTMICQDIIELLTDPERLAKTRQDLAILRGQPGAAKGLVNLLEETLGSIKVNASRTIHPKRFMP